MPTMVSPVAASMRTSGQRRCVACRSGDRVEARQHDGRPRSLSGVDLTRECFDRLGAANDCGVTNSISGKIDFPRARPSRLRRHQGSTSQGFQERSARDRRAAHSPPSPSSARIDADAEPTAPRPTSAMPIRSDRGRLGCELNVFAERDGTKREQCLPGRA